MGLRPGPALARNHWGPRRLTHVILGARLAIVAIITGEQDRDPRERTETDRQPRLRHRDPLIPATLDQRTVTSPLLVALAPVPTAGRSGWHACPHNRSHQAPLPGGRGARRLQPVAGTTRGPGAPQPGARAILAQNGWRSRQVQEAPGSPPGRRSPAVVAGQPQ